MALIAAGTAAYRRRRQGVATNEPLQIEAGAGNEALSPADEIQRKRNSSISQGNRLLPFFVLVFVLSVPLWMIGATDLVALPEDTPLYIPNLLWHISLAILPMIAALILGVFDVAGKYYLPDVGGFVICALMVVLLLLFPAGLYGKRA